MRSNSLLHIAACIALVLCASAPAQVNARGAIQSTPSADPATPTIPTVTVHVNGVVVSSVDGKPVSRVLVTSTDRRFAALTDWEGRFSFDYRVPQTDGTSYGRVFAGLVAGNGGGFVSAGSIAVVMLRKPGYVSANIPSEIPLPAEGETSATVRLKITPASTITGRITPQSGETPDGLRVVLRRRQAVDGIAQWSMAGFTQADRNGDFRFAALAPGDYQVMTYSWTSPLRSPRNRPDATQGLLSAYFPEGTGSGVTPLHLGAGQTAEVLLRPLSVTFYRISLGIDGLPAPNYGISMPSEPGLQLAANQSTHTVEGYLPTGSYTLRIEPFSPGLQPTSSRAAATANTRSSFLAHLEVGSSPLVDKRISAVPAADIQVNITREFTHIQPQTIYAPTSGSPDRPRPAPVYIELRRVDDVVSPGVQLDSDGDTVTLRGVAEGTYHVHINTSLGYVASAVSGSTNLLTEPLTVGSGAPPPFYVTLRDDFAYATFRMATASAASPADSRARVVVSIPLDSPEQRVVQNGMLLPMSPLRGVVLPPGRYLVLATDSVTFQTLEYRNPELLDKLMHKGIVVNLAAGQTSEVEVPVLQTEEQE